MNTDMLKDIIEEGKQNFPNFNVELVKKAYQFASKTHNDQFRKSGEPYITHPLAVANILTEWKALDPLSQTAIRNTLQP